VTNLDAIIEDLQPFPVRKTLVERQCEKHGLSPVQSVTDEKKVAICVVEILTQMITLNNVAESGVSISFDKESVKSIIRRKCSENGLDASNYITENKVTRLE
jgi:hypothetical protein